MANSQFRLYTSADAGAPQLYTYTGSLLPVLDWCLVTGSGWLKPFPNTGSVFAAVPQQTLGCWKQPSGSGCTFVVNDGYNLYAPTNPYEAWVTGWETLTTMSAANGTGSGQFPIPSQLLTTGHFLIRKAPLQALTGSSPWFMYVDSYTMYFFIWPIGDAVGQYESFFFGDIFSLKGASEQYRCHMSGRVTDATVAANYNDYIYYALTQQSALALATGNGVMSRGGGGRAPAVVCVKMGDNGKAIATGAATAYSVMAGQINTPNPQDNALYIAPIQIFETGGTIRGRMRGMYHVCHPIANFSDGQYFSGSGDYAGKIFQIIKQGKNAGMWAIETSNTVETN